MIYRKYIKRTLDIFFAIILIPIVCIILVPCMALIFFTDKKPIFYNAPRLGKDMKQFKMFKLRTMIVNAPDIRNIDGSTFNSGNDPRVTKIGRFLRKTSIDELPQLINVLAGDMSFVGPRPSPLGNEEKYTLEFKQKFCVKPGITGLNQATLRNTATMDQRVKNDVYYIKNISFILDVKIVIKTFLSVIGRKNINQTGEL